MPSDQPWEDKGQVPDELPFWNVRAHLAKSPAKT
jgi:hypothetical protein